MKSLTKFEQLKHLAEYHRYLKQTIIKLTENTKDIMDDCPEGLRQHTRDFIKFRLEGAMVYLKELEEFIDLIIKESK